MATFRDTRTTADEWDFVFSPIVPGGPLPFNPHPKPKKVQKASGGGRVPTPSIVEGRLNAGAPRYEEGARAEAMRAGSIHASDYAERQAEAQARQADQERADRLDYNRRYAAWIRKQTQMGRLIFNRDEFDASHVPLSVRERAKATKKRARQRERNAVAREKTRVKRNKIAQEESDADAAIDAQMQAEYEEDPSEELYDAIAWRRMWIEYGKPKGWKGLSD